MAHDLFLKNSSRSWSRGIEASASGSHLFEPMATIVVKEQPRRLGWFGTTTAIVLASRVVSGKWPWYWGNIAAKKLESKG
jgi:hypothetical protein